MNRQPRFNPYDPPATTAQDETVEHPPWWVVILMLAGAAISGVVAGSMTCLGVVAIGSSMFQSVSTATLMTSVIVVVTVGYLTARSSYREMVRNYWHKRTPLSERPDMQPPVSNAEDHHSSDKTFRP